MEGIDPRLRDTAPAPAPAPQHYEQHQHQHQRPTVNYDGGASQSTGYDALPQSSTTTSAGQSQQHQYYGMPTPGSYSSNQHQDASGSPYDIQAPQNSADPNDLKRPRACEACRQLKVRCEPDDNSPAGSCRRCAKASRQCVVTAPSRKRQKKTDSRVAELEKKIDALTATLHAQQGPGSGDTSIDPAIAQAQMAQLEHQRGQIYQQPPWPDRSRDSPDRRESNSLSSPVAAEGLTGCKRKTKHEGDLYNTEHQVDQQQMQSKIVPNPPQLATLCNQHPPAAREMNDNAYIDVIDRHIVDAATAYRMFDRYNTEMQSLPIVVFQPGTKAEDIRRSKPVLFLSILSAASNTIRPDLQPTFVEEVMRVLADRIIVHGEKAMELVQSLQVITIFYQPPERYDELHFNQLVHIAVVMGIDIGMGKRSRAGRVAWRQYMGKAAHADPNAAETRRAWLGLYFMCANTAMALRWPLLVRWSPYMDESLEVLAKAPDALPSDKWLAHVVRSQHIAEEVGYQFSMDDPPSDVSITQSKVQYQMKTFEKQLDEWRRNSTEDMPQDLLKLNEAIIDLYIHEIAMHHSHNIDDFRPPYGVEEENEEQPDYITPAHIDSLTICLDSIHKAFDIFLGLPLLTLRSLPTLFFVRNSYAAVALIKMYTAVSAKGSKFGSVFKPKDLKVEYYLDAMAEKMRHAAEGGQSRIAMKFTFVLGVLKNWQAKRVSGNLTSKDKGMPSVKNGDAGWAQHQQLLAQTQQDPKTTSWNATASNSNSNANVADPQHSGLQMLSEVAMGNNNNNRSSSSNSNTADPTAAGGAAAAAALAATTTQASWSSQLAAYAEMEPQHQQQPQQQSMPNMQAPADFYSQGYMTDLDNFTFTAEELGTLGNMMDDPTWLNFGLVSGGFGL